MKNIFRWLKLAYLRSYRRAHPMCSVCGYRRESGPAEPPDCMCVFRWYHNLPMRNRKLERYDT